MTRKSRQRILAAALAGLTAMGMIACGGGGGGGSADPGDALGSAADSLTAQTSADEATATDTPDTATSATTATTGTSDTSDTSDTPDTTAITDEEADTSASAQAPTFEGFSLKVEEGAYWDFRWLSNVSSFDTRGSSSSNTEGRYRVTLGAPGEIQGKAAYEVQASGRLASTDTIRWSHLAFDEHAIYGSADGASLTLLFDAMTGYWAGSGFFEPMDPDKLFVADNGSISNDFRDGPAVRVGVSSSEGRCEVILGLVLCGSSTTESSSQNEYWESGIGPVGYHRSGSFTSQFGGSSNRIDHGLVAYSLVAARPVDILETEANDGPAIAQPVELGTPLYGSVASDDPGFAPVNSPDLLNAFPGYEAEALEFEDWYRITVEDGRNYEIALDFSTEQGNARGADLDLIVFDENGESLLDGSASDNFMTGLYSETAIIALEPGTYTIAVWAFETSGSIINYMLTVE